MKRTMYITAKHLFRQLLPAAILLAVVPSCSTSSPQQQPEIPASVAAAGSPRLLQRAEEFRQSVAGCPEIGFGISAETLRRYRNRPAVLAARCALLGTTEVYCRITPEELTALMSSYPEKLREQLVQFHRYRIRCFAEIDGTDMFAEIKRGNDRHYQNMIKERLYNVFKFNRDGRPQERFDGISTIFLPHLADEMFARRNPDVIMRWSGKAFGVDNENDLIFREARQMMMAARNSTVNFPLAQHSADFYHDRVSSGDLSLGAINDYFALGDFVLLEDLAGNRNEMNDQVLPELKDARKAKAVMIKLITTGDFYSDQSKAQSLQIKSWPEITRDLKYLTGKWKKYPSFRGIAFSDYHGLETILSPAQ